MAFGLAREPCERRSVIGDAERHAARRPRCFQGFCGGGHRTGGTTIACDVRHADGMRDAGARDESVACAIRMPFVRTMDRHLLHDAYLLCSCRLFHTGRPKSVMMPE